MSIILDVQHVRKRYPKSNIDALNDLSFSVNRGEFFGLLGQNGSGKTTILSIICGLLKPSSGDVFIKGQSTAHHKTKLCQSLGLVPQEIALYPSLTLLENLTFFDKLYGLDPTQRQQRIHEVCELVGLATVLNQVINTFSGGMKRRANLAISLLHKPKLLLLDEPTVHVDPHSRQVIFNGLKALNQQGTTIIYTSHYMEEVEKLCTNMVLIDRGQKILEGNPKDLVAQEPDCKDLNELFLKYVFEKDGHE